MNKLNIDKKIYWASNFLQPIDDRTCQLWRDTVLIGQWDKKSQHFMIVEKLDYKKFQNKILPYISKTQYLDHRDSIIVPGFFDMHFHWVQDDVRLMPKDSLLSWLEKYTFPTEAKFENKLFTKKKAKIFFSKLLKAGTLGGACFSSVHAHALKSAFKYAQGDFVIGNVLMTMESPKNLVRSRKDTIKETKKLIKKYVNYCLTPRFAITTHPDVMAKTSKLADKYKRFKQSHLCETKEEISFVLKLYQSFKSFKNVKTYTEIYHRVGMLGKRSLMGHAIHLNKDELKILKKTDTVLVHCPTSNAPHKLQGLDSGLFNYPQIEKNKIRWVLGSDIGGGPYFSMLDVMQSFVEQHQKAGRKNATYTKALFRSTLAGAKVLNLEDRCGFKKGNLLQGVRFKLKLQAKDNSEIVLKRLISPGRQKRHLYEKLALNVLKGRFLY